MQQPALIVLILFLLTVLWIKLQRSFQDGICLALIYVVFLPHYLRIQIGSLPDLTIQRLSLILLFLAWIRHGYHRERVNIPLKGAFIFWLLANLCSLLLTDIDFTTSLKRFLDFSLEIFGFYFLASTTMHDRHHVMKMLRSVWIGLMLVAVFAYIEKYTRYNPVVMLFPLSREAAERGDVLSTMPHRILLGTAMVMGWALTMGLTLKDLTYQVVSPRWRWWAIASFLGSSYFCMSRGPWLAAIGCGLVLLLIGSRKVKGVLGILGIIVLITLIARPGVWNSISGLAEATVKSNSQKEASYKYRIELWKIAWHQITQSPVRFLFGYGPGAGTASNLEWELSYRDKERKIESWDNHYAYDLYQSGVIGFCATILLYGGALFQVFRHWRGASLPDRDVLASLVAIVCVMLFMMTNVLIFAKQLNFIFWTSVAVATSGLLDEPEEYDESEMEEEEEEGDEWVMDAEEQEAPRHV